MHCISLKSQQIGDAAFGALGMRLRRPEMRGTTVDRILECPDVRLQVPIRVQEKTASVRGGQWNSRPGFQVDFKKNGGTIDGKRIFQPYAVGDFDIVVLYLPEGHSLRLTCFYFIPAGVLRRRSFLQEPYGGGGKKTLYLYPPGTRVPLKKGRVRDEWANAYLVNTLDVDRARSFVFGILNEEFHG